MDKLDKILDQSTKVNSLPTEATSQKRQRRRASFNKNERIDQLLERLMNADLLMEDYWKWYASAIHQLGTTFVQAQATIALEQGRNPRALFHWLINKELDKRRMQPKPDGLERSDSAA